MTRPSPSTTEATIMGSVERVTYHTEETGYCVLKVQTRDSANLVTVLGNTPRVVVGERLRATGQWIQDSEYGRQFKAAEIHLTAPDSIEGMERYLGSGLINGIGPKYAKRILQKFGAGAFEIIENESARLEEVEGVGRKRRQEIRDSWMKQKQLHEIMLFLHGHGISTARAVRIHKTYGDQAIEILQRNPYQLSVDIHGVGFKTADQIAHQMGIKNDDISRLKAGIIYAIDKGTQTGHTCLPYQKLCESASTLLEVSIDQIQPALDQMLAEGTLVGKSLGEQMFIYTPVLLKNEVSIARDIKRLSEQPASYPVMDVPAAIAWSEEKTRKSLAPSQQNAVAVALQNRITIITGGPGVGKTTIVNTILTILVAKKVVPVLAAPTGRAAQRLGSSTGLPAKTLHRLMEFQGEGKWGRYAGKPLEGDLFVLDEVSMVDTPLMAHFLQALPPNAHVLLVGDVDQLPSVGPGSVLKDLIESKLVTTVKLTEVFRQAAESKIITTAHAINQGYVPDLRPASGADFFFLPHSDSKDIQQTIVQLCRQRLPAKYGFDPLADIQVLCPMNQQALGTRELNKLLQHGLNPPSEMKFEIDRFNQTYRGGDKVIQTRNNYDKEVFNGDIGFISRIDTEPTQVVVQFEGSRNVPYEPGELDELQLAYAITIHKSQGSEFPCVIVPWSMAQFIMLERSLLYTAVTRGRKLVIIVGEEKAIQMAVKKDNVHRRWTGLREALLATSSS